VDPYPRRRLGARPFRDPDMIWVRVGEQHRVQIGKLAAQLSERLPEERPVPGRAGIDEGEAAGVTRLTVYRHFPDDAALFAACSAHWISRQQLPDPGAWSQIGDPVARLRAGLADLYRFFRAGAGMLTCIYRDFAALPGGHQQALRDQDTLFRDVLTAPFGSAGDEYRRLRAVTGHAISFWTWRSLCLDQGLTDTEAIDAMTGMVLAITPAPQAEPVP
jgi:AcrR family transcriptional regulator